MCQWGVNVDARYSKKNFGVVTQKQKDLILPTLERYFPTGTPLPHRHDVA